MSAAHTPGPWEHKPAGCFIDESGKPTTRPSEFVIRPIHATLLVAGNVSRCEANARLISAAPDMLFLLRLVLDWAVTEKCALRAQEIAALRAAIAKATGVTA